MTECYIKADVDRMISRMLAVAVVNDVERGSGHLPILDVQRAVLNLPTILVQIGDPE